MTTVLAVKSKGHYCKAFNLGRSHPKESMHKFIKAIEILNFYSWKQYTQLGHL